MGLESEPEVEFNIHKIVVVLAVWKIAVIRVRVFCVNLYILAEAVVQTTFYLIDRCSPVFLIPIGLITRLCKELAFDQGHDAEYVPTIGFVTLGVVDLADIVARRGSTPTLAVDLLSTEGIFVQVVLSREGITVFLHTTGLG